ncbi:MAG TPA: hypothetical protein VKQ52_13050 [Puia sp.]|nr:hypothetical protein [Puia sp.]
MRANIMKSHVNRQFIREIERAFSAIYPFLKIEFPKEAPRWMTVEEEGLDAAGWQRQAHDLLLNEIGLTDGMTVANLETRLLDLFAVPVVILRRSGNFWIETSMTRQWSLKEQNDHGRELAGESSK